MANLFERPIAANPLSEFVGLPLELLQNSIQRRQHDYDLAKATIEQQRDTLLGTTSSAGDKPRHAAILEELNSKFDAIADEVGGDYSRVKPQLESLTRKIKEEISSRGELGSIHRNAAAMAEYQKDLDDRYSKGDISLAGYQLGLQSLKSHKTELGADNSWTSFRGYSPSPISNVYEVLDKAAKNVQAKYMADGNKIVSIGDVYTAMNSYLKSNPQAMHSLKENFQLSYKGDPKKADKAFEKYVEKELKGIASVNVYQEVRKKTDAEIEREYEEEQAAGSGVISSNWQVPGLAGSLGYEEGGASILKALGEKLGLGTTEAHNTWVKSAQGRETIKALEQSSGTKFPKNGGYLAQVNWIEDNASAPLKANLEFGRVTDRERKLYMTDEGRLVAPDAPIYNKQGKLLSKKEKAAIYGDGKTGPKPHVIGILREGVGNFTRGSVLIGGNDGEEYIQETVDPRVRRSAGFNLDLIKSTGYTNTGSKKSVTLQNHIINQDNGKVLIPAGTYETKKDPTTGAIKVIQNGKEKYLVHKVYDKTDGRYKDNIIEIQ